MKVASPVLRRGRASNRSFLFGDCDGGGPGNTGDLEQLCFCSMIFFDIFRINSPAHDSQQPPSISRHRSAPSPAPLPTDSDNC